jgi:hypothetical protein
MRIHCLAATIAMAALALSGCGGDDSPPPAAGAGAGGTGTGGAATGGAATGGAAAGGAAAGGAAAGGGGKPFELDGSWIYLGPSDVPHDLVIGDSSMNYKAVAGDWSSDWTINAYDNELHHFQTVFKSGSGTYLPMGNSMSGAYELAGALLTIQLAQDLTAYPQVQGAGTCTNAADGMPLSNCRLYIKGN